MRGEIIFGPMLAQSRYENCDVCTSVCLSVCWQIFWKSVLQIFLFFTFGWEFVICKK